MRRLDLALGAVFASLMFFADAAPGSFDTGVSLPKADRRAPTHPVPRVQALAVPIEQQPLDVIGTGDSDDLRPEVSLETPRKPTSLERARMALAQSNASPLPGHELCTTLVEVARSNDLPLGFFTNLIWRESRFGHDAISPVGAMGIAQFMPDVAEKLSLDAFDTRSALPASGRLLRTLRARFGNLGLAAAAYNAGPKRVSDWLEGRSNLPKETQDYVHLITGRAAAHWQSMKPSTVVFRMPDRVPCRGAPVFAMTERLERAQQERLVAEEARLAAQKLREAARRVAEEKRKHKVILAEEKRKQKVIVRVGGVHVAARVQANRPAAVRRDGKIRLAQVKR